MAWLLEIHDKDGNDLYPEIRRIAEEKNTSGEKHEDMYVMSTSVILATTAQSPVSTMQSTIRSLSNPDIRR